MSGIRKGDTSQIDKCSVGLRDQLIKCAATPFDIQSPREQGDVDIYSLLLRAFGMEDMYSLWWYESFERGGKIVDVPKLVFHTLLNVHFKETEGKIFKLSEETDVPRVKIRKEIVYTPKILAVKVGDNMMEPQENLLLHGRHTSQKIVVYFCMKESILKQSLQYHLLLLLLLLFFYCFSSCIFVTISPSL